MQDPSSPSLPGKGLYFVAEIVDVVVQAAEVLCIVTSVPPSGSIIVGFEVLQWPLQGARWAGVLGGQHAEVSRSQCLMVRVEGTELLVTKRCVAGAGAFPTKLWVLNAVEIQRPRFRAHAFSGIFS